MINNGWVFPIAVDDEGNQFQWVENDMVSDCEKCCFWDEKCRYFEKNSKKKGICFGKGYFKRIL